MTQLLISRPSLRLECVTYPTGTQTAMRHKADRGVMCAGASLFVLAQICIC